MLPDEKLLSSLQPIMQEWIEEGLLGRFLLVGPKSIHEDENDSLVINADLWANGSQGFGFYSVNLFEQIAQYEFEVVRLISLRTLEKVQKFLRSRMHCWKRLLLQ